MDSDGIANQDALFSLHGEDAGSIAERESVLLQDGTIAGRSVTIDQQDRTNLRTPLEEDDDFIRWLKMHSSLVGGVNWDVCAEVRYPAFNS
ncbi:hypothetical protein AB1N83_006082 [Pleurotus pulmonarius]